MFGESGQRVVGAADIEVVSARTLEDIDGGHFRKLGGPGRDRTDDLFHAMEARSQLRHRPTMEGTSKILTQREGIVKPSRQQLEY